MTTNNNLEERVGHAITKKDVLKRTIKNVGLDIGDTAFNIGLLSTLVSSSVVLGQLPYSFKKRIYRFLDETNFDKDSTTNISTSIARGANILGGMAFGGYCGYSLPSSSVGDTFLQTIVGVGVGAGFGFVMNVPSYISQEEKDKAGATIPGYFLAVPALGVYGAYKTGKVIYRLGKGATNYFGREYHSARNELEGEMKDDE